MINEKYRHKPEGADNEAWLIDNTRKERIRVADMTYEDVEYYSKDRFDIARPDLTELDALDFSVNYTLALDFRVYMRTYLHTELTKTLRNDLVSDFKLLKVRIILDF